MTVRPCASGCGGFLSSNDGHERCLSCLGREHAEVAFVDGSCVHCERMTMATLRSRLSFARWRPSSSTPSSSAGRPGSSAALVRGEGDLRVTVPNLPSGLKPPRKSGPSKRGSVEMPKLSTRSSETEPSVTFGAPEEDRMSITASEGGLMPAEAEASTEQPPAAVAAQSEADAELAAMLHRAAVSIGLEVSKAPSPERSRLDDWYLGARSDAGSSASPVQGV
ncbi:hypothetical protein QQF64_009818 [Cirrhinus molitorella]|uniref:Uncharacterized protein n=1 Tax=Cirrhinus molitorella TaxID=172907 RepID=A0ABR3M4R9_9TELE